MLEEAESEKLAVDGVIADITNYEAPDLYNIVVIDRVLHMLQNDEIRNAVLGNPVMQSPKLVLF